MIGEALGWKYDHTQGISTAGGKITGWPEALGDKPTQREIDTIVSDYKAHKEKLDLLASTETPVDLAGKLEELIDSIENGTPISGETKAWATNRKTIRG